MAELIYYCGTMDSGKSTLALQTADHGELVVLDSDHRVDGAFWFRPRNHFGSHDRARARSKQVDSVHHSNRLLCFRHFLQHG